MKQENSLQSSENQKDTIPEKSYGKVHVFLGYSDDDVHVRAMVKAAHRKMAEGCRVVGYPDLHLLPPLEPLCLDCGRPNPQIQNLITGGFETLTLEDMLKLHPELVLIEDLAKVNSSEARHPKRFQDVEELLSAGIDVFATFNIFQLESLNDKIFQITGIRISETVPDRLFSPECQIHFIDTIPGEVGRGNERQRKAVTGINREDFYNFFRPGNIIALRALALRWAAEQSDIRMRNYMKRKEITGPWPAGERILVCVSSHTLGEALIRTGKNLADEMKGDWYVLNVETPGHIKMPEINKLGLEANLNLADELGALVIKSPGQSVAQVVIDQCRNLNISTLVVGNLKQPFWKSIISKPILDEIFQKSGSIKVVVIGEDAGSAVNGHSPRKRASQSFSSYFNSIGMVAIATFISLVTHKYIDPTNLVMIYLAAVVLAAVYLGRGPSILASILSVVVFDFFMINPRFSLVVEDTQYLITLGGFLIVGLIISNSAILLRRQVQAVQEREEYTLMVNRFGKELTGASTLDQVQEISLNHFSTVFGGEVAIFIPIENRIELSANTGGYSINEVEEMTAEWVYKNNQPAGKGTGTNPIIPSLYVPLSTSEGVTGVLGIQSENIHLAFDRDKKIQLQGFISLAALAIERAKFAQEAVYAETLRSKERLQSALLNSISHQLRTPLSIITGVLTSLSEAGKIKTGGKRLNENIRQELFDSAIQQANTLNGLVENLLAMTRLESGTIKTNSQPGDVQDLIGAVINQMSNILMDHPMILNIASNLPPARMDPVLTGQVIINLLENACKFSDPSQNIYISAFTKGEWIEIQVADHGIGIPPDEMPHIFEKFFRGAQTAQIAGTGLGLSICKGIVEAQGGNIWAEKNDPKGTVINLILPISQEMEVTIS